MTQQIRTGVAAVADVEQVFLDAKTDRRGPHAVATRIELGALVHRGVGGQHGRDQWILTWRRRRIAGLHRVDDRADRQVGGYLSRRVTAHTVAYEIETERIVDVERVLVLGTLHADVGVAHPAQAKMFVTGRIGVHRGRAEIRWEGGHRRAR